MQNDNSNQNTQINSNKGNIDKINSTKKNHKRKKVISIACISILAGTIAISSLVFIANKNKQSSNITTVYNVQSVNSGSISSQVSGSGKLISNETTSVTMSQTGTVASVNKNVGDTVSAGEVIATIKSSSITSELNSLYSEQKTLNTKISNTSKNATSKYITSPISGVLKQLKVETGSNVTDIMSSSGYLCVISTDGKMKVNISSNDISKNDSVDVKIGDNTISGTVTKVSNGIATIEISKNTYDVGTSVTVFKDETELGKGNLELVNFVPITSTEGTISSILKSENSTVYSGTNLFKLESYPESETYANLLKQKEELDEKIKDLERQLTIKVDYNGIITSLDISVGDTVNANDTVAVINSTQGYTLNLSVDESDISTLKVGQSASITLDALEGTFTGSVSSVSYEGTTESAVTTYSVVVSVDEIDSAIPGMSASCIITTQTSDSTLIVPVQAVQSSRGQSYIYLADSNATSGDEIDSSNVNLESLTKVDVETGMSDGINISITGEIAQGTLILVPNTTSSNTGSQTSNQQDSNKMQNNGNMIPNMQNGSAPSGAPSQSGGAQRSGQ